MVRASAFPSYGAGPRFSCTGSPDDDEQPPVMPTTAAQAKAVIWKRKLFMPTTLGTTAPRRRPCLRPNVLRAGTHPLWGSDGHNVPYEVGRAGARGRRRREPFRAGGGGRGRPAAPCGRAGSLGVGAAGLGPPTGSLPLGRGGSLDQLRPRADRGRLARRRYGVRRCRGVSCCSGAQWLGGRRRPGPDRRRGGRAGDGAGRPVPRRTPGAGPATVGRCRHRHGSGAGGRVVLGARPIPRRGVLVRLRRQLRRTAAFRPGCGSARGGAGSRSGRGRWCGCRCCLQSSRHGCASSGPPRASSTFWWRQRPPRRPRSVHSSRSSEIVRARPGL